MAFVYFGVAGLFERAQHQIVKDAFFGCAGNLLRKCLVHARRYVDFLRNFNLTRSAAGALRGAAVSLELHATNGQRADAERISPGRGGNFEFVDALCIGLFMNAVERRHSRFKILRDAFVGGEHEFLDEAMRDIALRTGNAAHQALIIEFNDRFGKIEVNGAATFALAIENERQVFHAVKTDGQFRIALPDGRIAFEYRVYIGVGHAFSGANHAFVEFVAGDFSLMVDLHDAGENQTLDMGAQTANIGGKLQWQHGHGAVGKINARTSQAGFSVKLRTGRDKMGHVGDVHLQLIVAIFQDTNEHGIVEVARRFAVDCDDGKIAIVSSVAQFMSADDFRGGLSFLKDTCREAVRQVVFSDHDFYVDAEIV